MMKNSQKKGSVFFAWPLKENETNLGSALLNQFFFVNFSVWHMLVENDIGCYKNIL